MNNPNSKKYKGIIFDFNGTLLWDTKLHNHAWDIFLDKHNIVLSDDEKNKVIHGKTNEVILKIIFDNKFKYRGNIRFVGRERIIVQGIIK